MIGPDDERQLRIIGKATRTVGECLDWADHGGGDEAWALIRAQPEVVRSASGALSAEVRGLLPEDLIRNFAKFPEQYWSRLEDAVLAALPPEG